MIRAMLTSALIIYVNNDKKTNPLKLLLRWILTTIAVYLGWSVINYIIK